MEEWNPEFGDRKTQLVFIGTGMNEREVSAQLGFLFVDWRRV
ncbi:metallochaperone with NTPase activity [Planococcus antarcticus DSM 14505]|uniref:Metallochaperone with NTPase activity n=1 Tax=Planococcus antarcticus DSM 14505 TaxID=1185653 RepID=A0AA87IL35_9BACL|nr:metallochaperone with NTPase activity [Planococcus antarcticus DSM 14505]